MTSLRGSWTAVAAVSLFLLTACARADPAGAPGGDASTAAPPPINPDSLVLRVERVGGFMAPDQQFGRLPVVSVYADGRVLTQGPQIDIYPGPVLPNIQEQRMDPSAVTALAGKAAAAGVKSGADLGQPGVADAPTTRITVALPGGTRTVNAVALTEAQPDDPRLTPAQREARAKLAAFVQEVTDLSSASDMPEVRPYQPEAVAAFARPYAAPDNALPKRPAAIAWPGPALPGEPFLPPVGCVTATGAQAQAVLAAAKRATTITPWTSADRPWTVIVRPLLPDEAGCADLKGTR
jgi:hypothetical protein